MSMRKVLKSIAGSAIALGLIFGLASCSSESSTTSTSSSSESQWPRTVETDNGPVEITAKPERIVSSSVTLTGTLLAIDAPIVGSGATNPSRLTNSEGFFSQWASVADERDVQALYTGEASAEAILSADPDLVIMSKSGADSAFALYDQISAVVPVVVIDYSNKDWQEIATLLGEITGLEDEASATIADYEKQIASYKDQINLPEQPTAALVYNAGRSYNFWTSESAQGKLLIELGFDFVTPDETLGSANSMGQRSDIVQLNDENLASGFDTAQSIILISADESTKEQVMSNPLLVNTNAVKNDNVYYAGVDSFRLDYYSSLNAAQTLIAQLG